MLAVKVVAFSNETFVACTTALLFGRVHVVLGFVVFAYSYF